MREKIRKMTEAFELYHAALHARAYYISKDALEVKRLDFEIAFLEAVSRIAGTNPPAVSNVVSVKGEPDSSFYRPAKKEA